MNNYDVFARYYDDAMGQAPERIAQVRDIIHRHQPKAKSLLELACGTGTILNGLVKDLEVSGLDSSAAMLKVARAKLPLIHLYNQDMADFKVPAKFDVIICVFDSINHLTELKQWESLFAATARHLHKGGLFFFDMNTLGRLQRLDASPTFVDDVGTARQMSMTITKDEAGLFNWHLEFKTRAGTVLDETTIPEASFPLEQVEKALGKHFKIVAKFDQADKAPTDDSDRAHFVCLKR